MLAEGVLYNFPISQGDFFLPNKHLHIALNCSFGVSGDGLQDRVSGSWASKHVFLAVGHEDFLQSLAGSLDKTICGVNLFSKAGESGFLHLCLADKHGRLGGCDLVSAPTTASRFLTQFQPHQRQNCKSHRSLRPSGGAGGGKSLNGKELSKTWAHWHSLSSCLSWFCAWSK